MSASGHKVIWLLCCAFVLGAAYQIKHISFIAPTEVIRLDQASFSYTDHSSMRTLPDNWQWHQQAVSKGIYSFEFVAQAGNNDVWAVMIPTVRSNLRATLNGKIIGNGGSMSAPIASNLRRPLLFSIAPAQLLPSTNRLVIEVKSTVTGKGFLDQVYVGPLAALEPAYQRHYFFRISLVESITYGLLITAAFMASLAVLRRRNTEYAWFALAALLWAAHNATNHMTTVIYSNHFWDWLSYVTLGWFALVAPVITARFKGKRFPTVEKLILIIAIALPLLMFVLPQTEMHKVADYLWYPLALSAGGGALVYIGIDAWKTNDFESQLLTTSGLFIIPYAVHDLLLVQAILPWEDGFYIQFGAVVLLAVFTAILLYRLVSSTNEAEALNQNLSLEISRQTEQIQAAMIRNRQLEKQEWLAAERARITRDMHDGVAGQIASTLSSVQTGELSQAELQTQLEYCINDIRLMIDSLDNQDNNLVTLLGMFRYRVSPMLEQAGITLKWSNLDIDSELELTPSSSLHLLRVLQEAVNNVILHARCSELSICIAPDLAIINTIVITIEDNGCGFLKKDTSTDSAQLHRGLRNMRYRAEQINAELSINNSSSGTKLQLRMPTSAPK